MYLLSTVSLLLAVSAVQPYSYCDRGKWNHARNIFNSLSNDVINHDHDLQQTCSQFKQFATREVFGGNAFRLEVTCYGFENAVWEVQIKHRVIYINGHLPRQGETCDLTYVDIKVLPRFADTHAAAWIYKDGKFVVALPYKYKLDSHQLSCSQDIDETLIHVRRGYPNERIFGDV